MNKTDKMKKTIKKIKVYNIYEYKLKFFILLLLIMQIISSMKINKSNKIIRFIICSSPSHYNYGDDAILISTQEFLKAYFPHIKQIKIYFQEVLLYTRLIKYIINKNDIILLMGVDILVNMNTLLKNILK